jgi:hypothetical protein
MHRISPAIGRSIGRDRVVARENWTNYLLTLLAKMISKTGVVQYVFFEND